MRNARRWSIALIGTVFVLLAAAACGSSSSSSSGSGGSTGSQSTSTSAAPTAGPGLTSPTTPAGAKQTGGTVYYTEGAGRDA